MFNVQRMGFIAAALIVALPALAAVDADVKGTWVGNSRVDGDSAVAKTTLVLGAPQSDGSSLRLEGDTTCTLKDGSFDDGGALTFKQVNGGDACARLAQGRFVVRGGETPRQLQFEVTYPGAGGQDKRRVGALHRYP